MKKKDEVYYRNRATFAIATVTRVLHDLQLAYGFDTSYVVRTLAQNYREEVDTFIALTRAVREIEKAERRERRREKGQE